MADSDSSRQKVMGKKRKAGGKPTGQSQSIDALPTGKTKYDINEEFADSEDEFLAGRDKILLEDGPTSKRRKRVAEEGMSPQIIIHQQPNGGIDVEFQNSSSSPQMKKS